MQCCKQALIDHTSWGQKLVGSWVPCAVLGCWCVAVWLHAMHVCWGWLCNLAAASLDLCTHLPTTKIPSCSSVSHQQAAGHAGKPRVAEGTKALHQSHNTRASLHHIAHNATTSRGPQNHCCSVPRSARANTPTRRQGVCCWPHNPAATPTAYIRPRQGHTRG